jgi:hypothetical protein
VQFSPELRDGVAAGRITLTFRLWSRPQVKVGGRYAVKATFIEVAGPVSDDTLVYRIEFHVVAD